MDVCVHCSRYVEGRLSSRCQVCCNAFDRINEFAAKIIEHLSEYEFRTFRVGSTLRGSIRALMEILEMRGVSYDIKKVFNRRLSAEIEKLSGKQSSHNGEVVVTFDLENFDFDVLVTPVYIYGRYVKRVRNISQTRWICSACSGEGCEVCGYTGKKYVTSVEELIANPVIELFNARNAVLHGAGREDVDARMLGNGRPFVLEIIEPKKRYLDIEEVERVINEYCRGKVAVSQLRYTDSREVKLVKSERHRKKYRAKIVFEEEVAEGALREALSKLSGSLINQRTPRRVLHRRADRLRIRRLFSARLLLHRGKVAVVEFDAEAGLYIKELVSGDDGRTEPSLTSLLGKSAKVEKLDVIAVY